MPQFVDLISRNLGRGLLGLWLIGMGLMYVIAPGDATVRMLCNAVLGGLLIAAGVCTLLGR